MSPHKNDRARRLAVAEYLLTDERALERTATGHVTLDNAGPAQQRFQALLATCLMSSYSRRHPFDSPSAGKFIGLHRYMNAIVSRPAQLDIHTNTACRVASRLLPLLHHGQQLTGIPGLRVLDNNSRRLRLVHLPTDGRVDLIDSSSSNAYRKRDFRRRLASETRWHNEKHTPLWRRENLSPEEETAAPHWQPRPCTPVRTALMNRAMVLWAHLGVDPSWTEPMPHESWPELSWAEGRRAVTAHQVAALLTHSQVRIPGARFTSLDGAATSGLLVVGDSAAVRLRSE